MSLTVPTKPMQTAPQRSAASATQPICPAVSPQVRHRLTPPRSAHCEEAEGPVPWGRRGNLLPPTPYLLPSSPSPSYSRASQAGRIYWKSLAIVNIEETAPFAVAFDIVCLFVFSLPRWAKFLKSLIESVRRETPRFRRPFSSQILI